MIKNAYIDIDDTICDLISVLLKEYNKKNGTKYTPRNIKTWSFSGTRIYKENIYSLLDRLDILKKLKINKEIVDHINNNFKNPHFITARKSYKYNVYELTNNWLNENGIKNFDLSVTTEKSKVIREGGGKIFIDDNLTNLIMVASKSSVENVYKIRKPWNSKYEYKNIEYLFTSAALKKYKQKLIKVKSILDIK